MLTELKPVLALHCNEYILSSLYNGVILIWCSLIKQPTFWAASTGFPAKWRLRNERRNSILMTCHYPDLGRVSDWSWRVGNLLQPIRSTTQTWLVTHHQYGFSALVSQTSFHEEASGVVAKCRLFSQARFDANPHNYWCCLNVPKEKIRFFFSRATKYTKDSLRTCWLWYSQKQSVR